jgi:hypothetical protein
LSRQERDLGGIAGFVEEFFPTATAPSCNSGSPGSHSKIPEKTAILSEKRG